MLLVQHGHAHLSASPPSGPATFTYRHRPSTSACKQHRLRRCTAARLFSCHPSFSSLIQPSAGVPPRMPLAGVPPCVLHPSPSISIPLILPIWLSAGVPSRATHAISRRSAVRSISITTYIHPPHPCLSSHPLAYCHACHQPAFHRALTIHRRPIHLACHLSYLPSITRPQPLRSHLPSLSHPPPWCVSSVLVHVYAEP